MADDTKRGTVLRDLLCLCFGIGLFYFGTLGVRPFANPDESRYAEIPREMVTTGDWVTPRLNGVLYFEKPPICYWMSAVSIHLFGLHEAALRLWPASLGLATCLVVYATGRRIHGRTAGLAAAVILATSLLWFGLSQILLLDMAVSAFAAMGLCLFLLAVREPSGRCRCWLMLGVYVCLGLATLAKGLMGLLVPGAVMFLWVLLLNQWRKLRPLYLWLGVPLFLLITVPWHVLAAQATPPHEGSAGFFSTNREGQGFLWYYFMHEQVLRYLTPIHKRTEPFWFFFAVLPGGLFPWVTFLPQAVKSALAGGWTQRRERSEEWFYAIWVLFILLFFSASKSKLVPYILPVYPALALLLGRFFAQVWESPLPPPLRTPLRSLGTVTLLLAVLGPILLGQREWFTNVAKWPLLTLLASGLTASAAVAFWFATRFDARRAWLAPLVCAATIMLTFNFLAGHVMRPSAKAVCLQLKSRLSPDTAVFCLGDYYQDVPAYLGRLVGVADLKFENPNFEQSFGLQRENHWDRYLTREKFLELWQGPKRVFVVTHANEQDEFAQANPGWHPFTLFREGKFVLLSNRPDS